MATLTQKLSPILATVQKGTKSMDGIIEMLRLRINAETQFTNSLSKIVEQSHRILSTGLDSSFTVRNHGFEALFIDIKNEYFQRMEFLNSLKKDVYEPCIQMKQIHEQKHKTLIYETKRKTKLLEKHQTEYNKLKEKYDKIMSNSNKKSNYIKKQQPIIQRRYSQKQMVWQQQKHSFDNQINNSLVNIKLIEYQRINTLKDALTNWAAFITNLCANRNYDIQRLTQNMSAIDIEKDLNLLLVIKPNKNTNNQNNSTTQQKKSYAASFYAEFRRKQSITKDIMASKTVI